MDKDGLVLWEAIKKHADGGTLICMMYIEMEGKKKEAAKMVLDRFRCERAEWWEMEQYITDVITTELDIDRT